MIKGLAPLLSLVLVAALLAGCAGSNASNSSAAQSAGTITSPRAVIPAAPAPTSLAKSVFTIDQNSRDPFFPHTRKKVLAAATSSSVNGAPTAPVESISEMPAQLSAGLQGIGGTADKRIAVINNVILEIGRSATIPLSSGSHNRNLPVRCRDITRDTVVLDVEGYGQVVVTRKQML
jgi:hypothetical protein